MNSSQTKKKILITGGCGFIGSHLVEHYQGIAEIRIIDNLHTGNLENLKNMNYEFIEASILETDTLREAILDVDIVYHLAALTSVPESVEIPNKYIDINTKGTLNVLKAAVNAGVNKLFFASSAAVYGDSNVVPKSETMLPEPNSPYAISKLDGEHYCAMFTRNKLLPTVCARFFNVFGPRQDPTSNYAGAIPIFITRALTNSPLLIFGDGTQTRDFIYVKDIVSSIVQIMESPTLTGIYNLGSAQSCNINYLAEKIINQIKSKSIIKHKPQRPGDVKNSLADITKFNEVGLNFESEFKQNLVTTIDYYAGLTVP